MAPEGIASWGAWHVLPDLVDVGQRDLLLPPGIHPATLTEVEDRFVNTEPTYQRRVEIWASYNRFRTLVGGFVAIKHEYLDGSFVTSRAAPKDIDVSLWIDAVELDALAPNQSAALGQVWAERMTRFHTDAYLVAECDPGHAGYVDYQFWKERTESSWPAYKNRAKLIVPGVMKGYIEVTT